MKLTPLCAVLAVVLVACTKAVHVDISHVGAADAYPTQRYEFNLPHVAPRPATDARTQFARIAFVADVDLQEEARRLDIVYLRYELFPCDEHAAFLQTGDIFPTSNGPRYSYEAFVPANSADLATSTNSPRGWPERLRSEPLCFAVQGYNMAGIGLRSHEVNVDAIRPLIWSD